MNDTPHPDLVAQVAVAFDNWQAALHSLRRARVSCDRIAQAARAERTARSLYFGLYRAAYGTYPVLKESERKVIDLAPT